MTEEFVSDINNNAAEAQPTSEADMATVISKTASEETNANQIIVEKEVNNATEKVDKDAEVKVVDTTQNVDNTKAVKADESQVSVEALAEKLGWNKNHKGAEKVDAATYILKSREIQDTMRDTNKDLKGQVTSLNDSVEALKVHNERVYKADVKKLNNELIQLKKEKRDAVELADVAKVDELDEQIESIQKDLNEPQEVTKQTSDNPVYNDWVKDNQWYEKNIEMADYADTVAQQYAGAPLERVYSLVRQKVQEVFPDKFESSSSKEEVKVTEKENPIGPKSPVESGSNHEKSSTFTTNDLSASQRAIMNQFVGQGIMTEKQYVDDIAKLQEG